MSIATHSRDFLTLLLPVLILSLHVDFTTSQVIDVTQCNGYAQRGNGVVCYTKGTMWSWVAAQQQCRALGKNLLSVASSVESAAIATLLNSYIYADAWLGATSFGGTWTWLDGTELQRQGCFVDNQTNPDLTISTNLNNNSAEACTAYCINQGYAYAGLEARTLCSCGNSFGRYGQTGAQCITPCPFIPTSCGGPTSQDIIATNGSNSNWESGQPDNANQNQNCAVLDTSVASYRWYDVACTDPYYAICATSDPNFVCTPQNGAGRLSSGPCLYLVNQSTSYFTARLACTARGGDLVQLKTATDGVEVTQFINSVMPPSSTTNSGNRYYIGLVKLQWKWESGEAFLYTNWDNNEPTAPGQNCTRLKANGYWENVDCISSRQLVCQYTNNTMNIYQPGMITVQATTLRPTLGSALSAISNPITQSISSTTIPVSPGGNPASPGRSSSTTVSSQQAGPLNVALAAGIAGGIGGFFLILVIVIVVVCCVRCRKARAEAKKNDVPPKRLEDIEIPGSYYFGIEGENANPPPHSPLMAGTEKTDATEPYENQHVGGSSTFKK